MRENEDDAPAIDRRQLFGWMLAGGAAVLVAGCSPRRDANGNIIQSSSSSSSSSSSRRSSRSRRR